MLSGDQNGGKDREVSEGILVEEIHVDTANELIFNRPFRNEIKLNVQQFGAAPTLEWLQKEIGMSETFAKVLISALIKGKIT